uniref:Tyrosine aminotransferase n=1 Tax=Meloidogyne incognita TaxID=6306 RepID=A0A914MPT4_MELIC
MTTSSPLVPIITCDGVGKRYLVPGWRLGWLIVHDRCGGILSEIKKGIVALSQHIVTDITQGKLIKTFRGHQSYVFCCNFNPRSTLLVSGSFDGTHLCPFIACHSDPISTVGFNSDGSGDAAKNQVAMNPSNTVFDAKRLIGRKFDDPAVQSDMKHWPFKVIKEKEVSAMVLTKIKETVEEFLGQR